MDEDQTETAGTSIASFECDIQTATERHGAPRIESLRCLVIQLQE